MRKIFFIALLHFSLGKLFAQQIPLQTFMTAGGATGSVYPGTSFPTHFSSIGQPFVMARPISTNNGGGVMTANELMFSTSTVPAPVPTAQPTALTFSNVSTTSLTGSFTAATGSPAGYIVIRKAGSAPVSSSIPTIGTSYIAAASLGDATVVSVGTSTTFNDTGLTAATIYFYEIFSFNGSGATLNYLNTNPLSGNATTLNVDTTPPQITSNTTPSAVAINTQVPISVTVVEDHPPVDSVTISYGPANSVTRTSKDLTNTSGSNVWIFSVPGTSVTELGLSYTIKAYSAGGSATNSYSVGISYGGTGLAVPYTSFGSDVSNYRIVSVPLTLSSTTVNDVFGDDLGAYGDKTKWRMYRYDNGNTTELSGSTTIDAGKGYWLIARSSATINTGTGNTVPTSSGPFQIDLKADWNEIGNPYNYNLSWADVQTANPGLPGLTVYNGSFDNTPSVLKKLEGGFVKVTAAQKLIFPVLKNASVNGRITDEPVLNHNPLDNTSWQVYLNMKQGDLVNTISGFGMNEKASTGFDSYDAFNLPRFFDKSLLLNHTKKEGKDYYSRDIVPTSENQLWEFIVESTSDDNLITMTWNNSYFGQNEKELYLWDVNLQLAINMRASNSYPFSINNSSSFKIIFGSADFVKEKIAVQELVLHTIWPNPSSGDATLSFSLPESSSTQSVEFSVVDIMGRTMWTNQGNFNNGYNEVTLKRTNEETAGVYIVRLTSGPTVKQTRLVIK